MAFTYTLATNVGDIRLEIGDSVEDDGVRPNGRNFSDEELTQLYAEEGTIGRTAARCAEILTKEWASRPTEWKLGPQGEKVSASEYWKAEASRLRNLHGFTDDSGLEAVFDWYDPYE